MLHFGVNMEFAHFLKIAIFWRHCHREGVVKSKTKQRPDI